MKPSERITNETLISILDSEQRGTIKWDLAADLRQARAYIEHLERLSASQEEALQAMERGAM